MCTLNNCVVEQGGRKPQKQSVGIGAEIRKVRDTL